MATVRLDERRVRKLKPRKSTYDIRDRELKGFGIRVLPSGAKRYFIHSQHQGRRVWKIVGQAGSIGLDEARDRARTLMAAIRNGGCDEIEAPPDTPFETVADEVFRRYARNWKPSTLKVNLIYYRNQILPWFEGRRIDDIAAHDVQRWFASLHETPVAADRSAPVLSVIMRQAEVYGYRAEGTNPCTGIKRYRRQGRERFLSAAEMCRLGDVLARHEADRPQAVAIVRLLLLTGCRKSQIATLKWSYYREGKLFLPDSKVGPRTIWLSSAACAILDGLPRTSVWVFPPLATDRRLPAHGPRRQVLASREGGSGPVRGPPSRPSTLVRQYGARAGRDGADHRPSSRAPRSGDDAEIHAHVRRDGARGDRGRRRRPQGELTHGREEEASVVFRKRCERTTLVFSLTPGRSSRAAVRGFGIEDDRRRSSPACF